MEMLKSKLYQRVRGTEAELAKIRGKLKRLDGEVRFAHMFPSTH